MTRNIDTIGPRDTPPDDWWGDDAPDDDEEQVEREPDYDIDHGPDRWDIEDWQDNQ